MLGLVLLVAAAVVCAAAPSSDKLQLAITPGDMEANDLATRPPPQLIVNQPVKREPPLSPADLRIEPEIPVDQPAPVQESQIPAAMQQAQVQPEVQHVQAPPTAQEAQAPPIDVQQTQSPPDVQQAQVPPDVQQTQVPPPLAQDQQPVQPASQQPQTVSTPETAPPEQQFPIHQIIYLNLDFRDDRRGLMETLLAPENIPFQRFPAVKISSLDEASRAYPEAIENRPINQHRLAKSSGMFVLSVFLSHFNAYKKAQTLLASDNDEGMVLILEDDVKFEPNWKNRLSDVLKELPQDWDVLRLGVWGGLREQDRVSKNLFFARPPFHQALPDGTAAFHYAGAHAVLMRKGALPRVLQFMHDEKLTDVDAMLTTVKLRSFATSGIVQLVNSPSNNLEAESVYGEHN